MLLIISPSSFHFPSDHDKLGTILNRKYLSKEQSAEVTMAHSIEEMDPDKEKQLDEVEVSRNHEVSNRSITPCLNSYLPTHMLTRTSTS